MRRANRPAVGFAAWAGLVALAAGCLLPGLAAQSSSVRITLPAAVGFAVTNVGVSTIGNPNPTSVSFANLTVPAGRALRISVKADSNFVPPSGTAIPAARVSWTTSGASNGTGSSGTLSTTVYRQVFRSTVGRGSGSVNVRWTLAAPGTAIRAGQHSLTVRWRLESFAP